MVQWVHASTTRGGFRARRRKWGDGALLISTEVSLLFAPYCRGYHEAASGQECSLNSLGASGWHMGAQNVESVKKNSREFSSLDLVKWDSSETRKCKTWNCPGIVLELSWNDPGNDREWYWNGPGIGPKTGIVLELSWNGPGMRLERDWRKPAVSTGRDQNLEGETAGTWPGIGLEWVRQGQNRNRERIKNNLHGGAKTWKVTRVDCIGLFWA